jgi:hypothetical protein
VIASMVDGRINLSSFLDESVLRPDIQRRLSDIHVIEEGPASNEGSDLSNGPVTVSLSLKNGSTVSKTITLAPGSPADPITPEQLEQKWVDCLKIGRSDIEEATVRQIFAEGRGLNDMSGVAHWLDAVCQYRTPIGVE